MKKIQSFTTKLVNNLEKVIVGKGPTLELVVIGLLCQGHLLIDDVPGVGKTMLVFFPQFCDQSIGFIRG